MTSTALFHRQTNKHIYTEKVPAGLSGQFPVVGKGRIRKWRAEKDKRLQNGPERQGRGFGPKKVGWVQPPKMWLHQGIESCLHAFTHRETDRQTHLYTHTINNINQKT